MIFRMNIDDFIDNKIECIDIGYAVWEKFDRKTGSIVPWILHELEAFICKALKGEAIVNYASPLITQQMEASGSPALLGRSWKRSPKGEK